MEVWKEHLEQKQDPLLDSFRKIALEVANKYKLNRVKKMLLYYIPN